MATFNNRVLIVDDEHEIVDSLKNVLVNSSENEAISNSSKELFGEKKDEGRSLFVDVALSGSQGLEKVKESLDKLSPYAVIFLDIRMPNQDGVQTAFKIREMDPFIEIIFMSAFSDYSPEELYGFFGRKFPFLTKPFSKDDALREVNESLLRWNDKAYRS
ncbi:MAG: response regulator [Bdellovibrionota bacterium]|nr:response regulator [Bdellovibrionota bacterium]